MATPSQRRINFKNVHKFGTQNSTYEIPDLTILQTQSYRRFLQEDVPPLKRENVGLEAVLREIFPIETFDKTIRLEYRYYELEKPRYEPDECRQLRLTYGKPFKVRLRLVKEGSTHEEDVYLGDIPIMLGGGEFIINGAERVVVSQLHRSPGIDFVSEMDGDRRTFSCRVIPERGSWIELNMTRKETISAKIDQSSKLPIMMFLRAMSDKYGTNSQLMKAFYQTEIIKIETKKIGIPKLPKPASQVKPSKSKKTKKAAKNETVAENPEVTGESTVTEIPTAAGEPTVTEKPIVAEETAKESQAESPAIDLSVYTAPFRGKVAVSDIVYPQGSEKAGQVIVETGEAITDNKALEIIASGIKKIEVIEEQKNKLLLNSLAEDKTSSHEEALAKIYMRLRPGNPPQMDKARELFYDKFFDTNRYRLGRVGRFRINRKLGIDIPLDEMTLKPEDIVEAVRYLNRLWGGDRTAEVDDIDHLGNRRLRTIDELAGEELRKGFLKLRRTVQERLASRGTEEITPRQVINQKSISAAIEYFFGRGELSQVVDQTNPLSMLTHERRLSALGPGGLNRKRAGFDVRDVHSSHYGRICPIETPEGTNIGLISSLSIYATVDEFGFLVSPYRKLENGKLTNKINWLRADEEHEAKLAPADIKIENGKIIPDEISETVIVRYRGDYDPVPVEEVEYIDVSPSQMIGVSAGLIPFLEHDDANRALMGSNMQRQAVPLLISEPPLVATGLEGRAAFNSSLLIHAKRGGTVSYIDSQRIIIDYGTGTDEYVMRKFVGLNERTCQNQVPIVKPNEKIKTGQIIADGASMYHGELCLGRNVLVAFMAWDGFNFEDAIIISEDLVKKDTYTSIHIEEFDVEIRDTKLGREEFTDDIPNVGEKALRNLDETGIVRVGTYVRPGDILVGKVTPKSKTELTPEEKLLHAIFGRAGEDVKNESLEVPSGVEGIVIGTQKFSCRMSLSEDERKAFDAEVRRVEKEEDDRIEILFKPLIEELEKVLGHSIDRAETEQPKLFRIEHLNLDDDNPKRGEAERIYQKHWPAIETAVDAKDRKINSMKRGDELRRGVLQMVKVYVAAKRVISVGDKMAGRHGNKGVIAKILPREDMPYLADGTPIEIMLNPLGVPSRMNVGQILETHLGWAAAKLGYQAVTPVFDGASEQDINDCLEKAGLPRHGKVRLYDGRTGEPFDQETTVGYIYMLKLHHLVDDKVHARSTGPYSLITQQPLGGKARFGGQRFGEMEVWALEAYGAAYTLQELLTVKSDDVEGRTKIYESMVKGENTLEAGTPASFDVLTNEIRGLALNMQLEKSGGVGL
ncbi:MAG: DNA-directed RNA polymerase subunit beta [Planctomycetaceae bacterium]|jgi:DNA-directed RNA polymerase subunit beta|nr:DNA-directed RNA polymerase subunit beta [Planctomycetaceae bacterium]